MTQAAPRFEVYVMDISYFSGKTTPIIDWFEERFPEGRVLPDDPDQAFFARTDPAKARVRRVLEQRGAWEPLWRDGIIASRLHEDGAPPVCRPPQGRARLRLLRSPWNPVAAPRA